MLCQTLLSPFPFGHFEAFTTEALYNYRLQIHMLELIECTDYTSFSSAIVGILYFFHIIMLFSKSTLFNPYCSYDIIFMNWTCSNFLSYIMILWSVEHQISFLHIHLCTHCLAFFVQLQNHLLYFICRFAHSNNIISKSKII